MCFRDGNVGVRGKSAGLIVCVGRSAPGPNYGNRIEFNTITGSANHDCHDPSTVNQWMDNAASTQSAANLCFTGAANGVAD